MNGIFLVVQQANVTTGCLHVDFGHSRCAMDSGFLARIRRCGDHVQKVDFPHTAADVAPDSPQGTRWVSRVPYANFYLFGALGTNSQYATGSFAAGALLVRGRRAARSRPARCSSASTP